MWKEEKASPFLETAELTMWEAGGVTKQEVVRGRYGKFLPLTLGTCSCRQKTGLLQLLEPPDHFSWKLPNRSLRHLPSGFYVKCPDGYFGEAAIWRRFLSTLGRTAKRRKRRNRECFERKQQAIKEAERVVESKKQII